MKRKLSFDPCGATFAAVESDIIFNYLGAVQENAEDKKLALELLAAMLNCTEEDIQEEFNRRL